MNSRDRMAAVSRGVKVDRIPFLPTIFEHSARLLNKTPSETARDAALMEEAQVRAFQTYGHDSVTVGVDVYNIEAEALGCEIRFHSDCSIPGVLSHPYGESFDASGIAFSTGKGRIGMVLDAAENVKKRIGSEVGVGLGICGPFSIIAELAGYDDMIMECMIGGKSVHGMLKAALAFQKNYCDAIISRGLGVTIFESWATPPLISPSIYREYVMPYEQELIGYVKDKGVKAVPLVIGGDTTPIVDDIIETGTTLLVADYKADIGVFLEKASKNNLLLRGNIDPKLVERGPREEIIRHVDGLLRKVGGYPKFVLGTGVIPYDTPQENVLTIKEYLIELSQ